MQITMIGHSTILLECGGRKILFPMTMGEKQAVQAAQDLRSSVVIPIYLGVQPQPPLMRTRQTPTRSPRGWTRVLPDTEVIVLREGERWSAERGGARNEN